MIEELLTTLREHAPHGVVCLVTSDDPRQKVYCWWGDRDLCAGLVAQASYGLSREISQVESAAEPTDECPADIQLPMYGTYL